MMKAFITTGHKNSFTQKISICLSSCLIYTIVTNQNIQVLRFSSNPK